MPVFQPRSRSELYADFKAKILAMTPVTSVELGNIIDNIAFGVIDPIHDANIEMANMLALLDLDNTTGSDLDAKGLEYPDMAPRFSATKASGQIKVEDPTITKISTTILTGGGSVGNQFLNATSTAGFPTSGTLLIGNRGDVNFEQITYTNKTINQFNPTSPLQYDHAASEPIVLATVGDRYFPGPFLLKTQATSTKASKQYSTTSGLNIYDGEQFGYMSVESQTAGTVGNTPSNTINTWVGSPPFEAALANNPTSFSNGIERESDDDFRARIRLQTNALSSANVDAIFAALNKVNLNGQRIVFRQFYESPDPTLPAILFIDDGQAFIPSYENIDTPVVLEDVAFGGKTQYHIPMQYMPLVVLPGENITRIFSNIVVELNSVQLVQGDGAGKYRVQPDSGLLLLGTALNPNDHLEITTMWHYTGLIAEANKQIYGDRSDRTNYPGVTGIGSWIQITNTAIQYVTVAGTLVADGTRLRNDILVEIQNNLLDYVNSLGIAGSVSLSKLISLCMVLGVTKITLTSPSDDIIIPDGTMARLEVGNINIA